MPQGQTRNISGNYANNLKKDFQIGIKLLPTETSFLGNYSDPDTSFPFLLYYYFPPFLYFDKHNDFKVTDVVIVTRRWLPYKCLKVVIVPTVFVDKTEACANTY